MARPTKLTDEAQTKIVNAIAAGNYLDAAAQYGGVTYDTLNDWMNKGKDGKAPNYVQFYHAVKKAEADAEILRVARINKAGQEGNWQADAWYLERRYPDKWGRRVQQTEISGRDGGDIVIKAVDYRNGLAAIATGDDGFTDSEK